MKKTLVTLTAAAVLLCLTMLSACGEKPVAEFPREAEGVREGTFYTLYVNSFADSNNDLYGDLQGVIDKLDYLNDGDDLTDTDLGVTGIWLLPIFKSPSMHKYNVTDYYSIDPNYGTMETFEKLIEECKKRGIAVILDLVLNCTSNEHPWFVSAINNPNSVYRDYFHIYDGSPRYDLEDSWWVSSGGSSVWQTHNRTGEKFLALYGGLMPDFNFDSPALRAEIQKIAKFWLEKGIDGFRLDSAMHLYSNAEARDENGDMRDFHALNVEYWQEFTDYCKSINPDVFLVGEVWTNSDVRAPYFDGLDSVFNFSIGYEIMEAMKPENADGNTLARRMQIIYDKYAAVNPDFLDTPFLTNHDMERSMTTLGADAAKMRQAASFYLTLPGLPFIYYGEETGQQGSSERNRTAFIWKEGDPYNTRISKYNFKDDSALDLQLANPDSLWHLYQKLIKLRNHYPALHKGAFEVYDVAGNVSSYKMKSGAQELLIIHNTHETSQSFALDLTKYRVLLSSETQELSESGTVTMKAYSSLILLPLQA